jgi:ComF family protein
LLEGWWMSDQIRPWARRWPRALARALLPSSCALCGAACDGAVCACCWRQYLGVQGARCRRCANLIGSADARFACGACQSQMPAYDDSVVATNYSAPLDRLVLQLKFGGMLALAPWFAQALGNAVCSRADLVLPNLLCPVPLGPARLVERGFNQALEIARPLSKRLGIPLHARLAIRPLDTLAQSGVTPAERKKNIRNAFIIAPEALALVRGQHIGIVDDVMTSGHTLAELARLFKRFGAVRVSNFVFARTPLQ